MKKCILKFFEEMLAIASTMPISMSVLQSIQAKVLKDYMKFVRENCQILEEDGDSMRFNVPEDQFQAYEKHKKAKEDINTSTAVVPRSYIIMLVSQFDAYVGSLIRETLTHRPEILRASERQLSYSDLENFTDIGSAIGYLVDQEVESVLRSSHDDQIAWFEKKLKIELRKDQELIQKFVEITERRNLFTHNDGIVNETYLKNCQRAGVPLGQIQKGEVLDAGSEYYKSAVDTILEIGIKLGHVVWRHVLPEQTIDSEKSINELAFRIIKVDEFEVAIKIIKFALESYKRFQVDSNRKMLIINLAQCHLWCKRDNEALKLLNETDWSMCNVEFKICIETIRRNFSQVVGLLEKYDGKLNLEQYDLLEWPVFKELRQDQTFKDFFSKKYGASVEEVVKAKTPKIARAIVRIE